MFFLSLIGRMFPPFTTLIPIYLMVKYARLMDTRFALILIYVAFLLPLVLLILREFFSNVPVELCECARIDGCNNFQIFLRMVLPLSVNGLLAAGVLCFVNAWNEFLFAFMFLDTPDKFTLSRGVVQLASSVHLSRQLVMAASVIVTVPILLLFLFFERHLVRGLMAGAIKG